MAPIAAPGGATAPCENTATLPGPLSSNRSDCAALQCQIDHAPTKIFIGQSSGFSGFRKQTRFSHAREGVDFEHDGLAFRSDHHVNPRVVATTNCPKCRVAGILNF